MKEKTICGYCKDEVEGGVVKFFFRLRRMMTPEGVINNEGTDVEVCRDCSGKIIETTVLACNPAVRRGLALDLGLDKTLDLSNIQ